MVTYALPGRSENEPVAQLSTNLAQRWVHLPVLLAKPQPTFILFRLSNAILIEQRLGHDSSSTVVAI